jgi:hypothetical protein
VFPKGGIGNKDSEESYITLPDRSWSEIGVVAGEGRDQNSDLVVEPIRREGDAEILSIIGLYRTLSVEEVSRWRLCESLCWY